MRCPYCIGARRPCRACRGRRVIAGPCRSELEQRRETAHLHLLERLDELDALGIFQRRRAPVPCACGAGGDYPTDAHAVGCPHRLVDPRIVDAGALIYRGDRVDR